MPGNGSARKAEPAAIDSLARFSGKVARLNDEVLLERIRKAVARLGEDPLAGKPMRYGRKRTRELRAGPFRLSYVFLRNENRIVLLDFYPAAVGLR